MNKLKLPSFLFLLTICSTTIYSIQIGWIEVTNRCTQQRFLSLSLKSMPDSNCRGYITSSQQIHSNYSQIFTSLDNKCRTWELLGASQNYSVPINTKIIMKNGSNDIDCICTAGCVGTKKLN